MPAWRAASFVGPVLESLAAQTYENLDVLISVDLCDDGTAELCERFAAGHPNFTVVRQPTRLGWIGNSNALLDRAEGDCFFFAFHDDPVKPTYVSQLVEALQCNPDAVLAYSDMISGLGIESYRELEGVTDRFERARRLLFSTTPWWCAHRGLFRAGAAKRVGGLRRHLGGEYGADWPWLVSLALEGGFVRVPEPLVFKNRRPDGLNAQLLKSTSLRKRLGVRLACLRAVRRARPAAAVSMRLHALVLVPFAREEWWNLQRRLLNRSFFNRTPD
jgi:glycosyltransferase involved in cell wall biosynthesis